MMILQIVRRTALALLAAALLAVAPTAAHADVAETNGSTPIENVQEEGVKQELDKQLAERRKAMLEEAHAALDETRNALRALDEGETKEALEALARATGKLELLVVRDPELALAPVGVDFVTHDLYASPQSIRKARDRAEDLLEDGRIQAARNLLSGLASEIVISVTNLPLATYPDAIKAVSPLIDAGQVQEAKAALTAALNTLVVTNQVVSLPVLRARSALDEAEQLMAAETVSEEDAERVGELVKDAREQIEMAELLGYGHEDEYEEYRSEIEKLEVKIEGDEETRGVFAKLRSSLDDFQASFFE